MNRKAGLIVSGLVAITASLYAIRNAEFSAIWAGDSEWHGPSIYASFPDMKGFNLMFDARRGVRQKEILIWTDIGLPCQFDTDHLIDANSGWGTHDTLNTSLSIKSDEGFLPRTERAEIYKGRNEYGCKPEAKR